MLSGWGGCWSRRAPPGAVPPVEESLRDLVRAREDLHGELRRARHRLAKLLLRDDVRFDGPQAQLDPGAQEVARVGAVRSSGVAACV
jgi:hypothetical protein